MHCNFIILFWNNSMCSHMSQRRLPTVHRRVIHIAGDQVLTSWIKINAIFNAICANVNKLLQMIRNKKLINSELIVTVSQREYQTIWNVVYLMNGISLEKWLHLNQIIWSSSSPDLCGIRRNSILFDDSSIINGVKFFLWFDKESMGDITVFRIAAVVKLKSMLCIASM